MNRGDTSPAVQMVGSRIEAFCQNTVAAVESSPRMRKLAIGILGVWSSGVLAANAYELGVLGETEQIAVASACEETDIACMLVEDGLDVPEAMRTGPLVFSNPPRQQAEATTATSTLPPPPPPPAETTPPPTTEPAPPAHTEYRTPVSPETAAAVEAMNLTPEGYQQFFSNIDISWFDYAQNLVNFNPSLVSDPVHTGEGAIAQNATEWVTAHYTASYTNPDGPGSTPVGEMVVNRLIDFLSNRGRPCCAINFIIDRHGQVIQTAPYWAKLRHNPPYDGRTVGFEIEAADQSQITAKQYESATYLTIAILQNSELLNNRPLAEIFRGHGEMRDPYREQNPGTNLGQRNDFDEPIMNILRPKMEMFLQNTPQIAQLTQPLR